MSERFERHARTVSLLTGLSRVTGLVRDAAFSRVLGAGGVMDAFFFAFMIPNLFRRLFGEGALSAAFLPVYTALGRDEPAAARALASRVIGLLVVGLGAVTILAEIALLVVLRHADHAALPVRLTMITLPYMPLVCLVAILGAMLQVHGRFGPTAAAPIVLNACLVTATIGGAALLERGDRAGPVHVAVVAAAVVVAGLLQVGWSLFALRGFPWWTRDRAGADAALGRVLRQAVPMILGLGVLQLNTLLDGFIASYPGVVGPTIFGVDYPLSEGAMSSVSYAQRLYQFPLGVFGIAVATAIFPALARQRKDAGPFIETVRRGLRLVVFIGLPASAGLMLVRVPLTRTILEGGDFGAEESARVAFVLLGYAPAVWAYSMIHVLTRAFYARGEATAPVKVAVGVVALNFALNVTLIWTPLREAGLAWSTALCAIVQATILLRLLGRRVGPLADAAVRGGWGRSAGATIVMAAITGGAAALAPAVASWGGACLLLTGLVLVGGTTYAAAARALRMPELGWTIRPKA